MSTIVKFRVPVRVSQPGASPTDGFLMLTASMDGHGRGETLMELLNSPRIVLPFIGASDGQVVLLVRANIDWVAVAKDAEPRLVHPPTHRVTHGQRIRLAFNSEHRIEAIVQWDRTDPGFRLSDFLDTCPDFFPVVAGFGPLFVNRQRVRQMQIGVGAPEPVVHNVLAPGPPGRDRA